jgi:thiol-disulfide isomerase/thioredoxin
MCKRERPPAGGTLAVCQRVEEMMSRLALGLAALTVAACGSSSRSPEAPAASSPGSHGTISSLSTAKTADATFCEHRVPADVCTRHNPHLVGQFKEVGDWCAEHGVPESQCYECHPDLSFEPLPEAPPDADIVKISERGEDVSSLETHLAPGKVTIFDFYADWCAPCRKIDAHVLTIMQKRSDIAVRKLNLVSWETPIAARLTAWKVEKLPYVIVYGKDGKQVRAITGFDLDALDKAIADGGAR